MSAHINRTRNQASSIGGADEGASVPILSSVHDRALQGQSRNSFGKYMGGQRMRRPENDTSNNNSITTSLLDSETPEESETNHGHPFDDPRQSPQRTASAVSDGSRPSHIDTNMLLQSAARSVLDETSPAMSDDRSEMTFEASARGSFTLQSLETKQASALPDEQDRKRFVGCLAAVLASSYEFDVVDDYDDCEASRMEAMAYLDSAEDSSSEDGDVTLNQNISGSSFESELDPEHTPLVSAATITRAPSNASHIMSSERVSRELHKIRLSRARHRRRRYELYAKFLADCAAYLRLEKGQARAFLPMLSKLLVPQQPPPETNKKPRASLWGGNSRRTSGASDLGILRTESDISQTSTADREKIISELEGTAVNDFSSTAHDIFHGEVDAIEHLRPFLDSMTPGGGFRCLAMVMLQHLLHSKEGYDARIRNAIKRLGVLLLVHEMENDPAQIDAAQLTSFPGGSENGGRPDLITLATRRFESLEHFLAKKIILLSREQARRGKDDKSATRSRRSSEGEQQQGMTREQFVRGLKVAGVGAAAATLFAVTGGLAAPGIAAAAAAVAGGTAATAAAAAMLTSTAAVTAIFGVGGGTLVAYKMNRRTVGVTEFEFRKETGDYMDGDGDLHQNEVEAELFQTIAIAGWLRDMCDYQRPWGVSPSNPWIKNKQELLERFYAIHRPENIQKARKILESWEGEEDDLWKLLKKKYGRDPDHIFPLDSGPRFLGSLTLDQQELVDRLVVAMGYTSGPPENEKKKRNTFNLLGGQKNQEKTVADRPSPSSKAVENASAPTLEPYSNFDPYHSTAVDSSTASSVGFESISTHAADPSEYSEDASEAGELPNHVATVWDYRANYGGELYTVRWESELLTELCDSVADLAFDLVSGGTAQILKHTALSAVMSAVAWPYALVNAANMIDGTWTLAVERSDEAGRELARSLLFSTAGHRPVTLVGFSFGARVIYSCLKELARYQEKWCEYREKQAANGGKGEQKNRPVGEEDSFEMMREPASIVEDAVMIGLPNHLSLTSWRACRQVVAGRLVNCFSQKDLILSLMFQVKRLKLKPVCGACPVAVGGVENIDVTDIISGHEQYCTKAGEVLKRVRHGQPFRSRPTRLFEVDPSLKEETPTQQDKYDV